MCWFGHRFNLSSKLAKFKIAYFLRHIFLAQLYRESEQITGLCAVIAAITRNGLFLCCLSLWAWCYWSAFLIMCGWRNTKTHTKWCTNTGTHNEVTPSSSCCGKEKHCHLRVRRSHCMFLITFAFVFIIDLWKTVTNKQVGNIEKHFLRICPELSELPRNIVNIFIKHEQILGLGLLLSICYWGEQCIAKQTHIKAI